MARVVSYMSQLEALVEQTPEGFDPSVLFEADFVQRLTWVTPETVIGRIALRLGILTDAQVPHFETYLGMIRTNLGDTSTITVQHEEGTTTKLFVALDALDTAINTHVDDDTRWQLYSLRRRTRGLAAVLVDGFLLNDEAAA